MLTANGNLLLANAGDSIYQLTNFTDSVALSFTAQDNPVGCSWDGTNVLSTDEVAAVRTVIRYTGKTDTIDTSFAAPGTFTSGCCWTGTNLITQESVRFGPDIGWLSFHSGFTDTVTSSHASPTNAHLGVDFDGTNLLTQGFNSGLVYKHDGTGETILGTMAVPSGGLHTGLCWDTVHVVAANRSNDQVHRLLWPSGENVGTVNAPGNVTEDIAWDDRFTGPFSRRARSTAALLRKRRQAA